MDDPATAGFLPLFAALVALYGVIGAAALAWAGARRRAWFWLVAIGPGALLLLVFGFQVTYALAHPADPAGFVPTLLGIVAAIVIIVGGVVAFLEVRRGEPLVAAEGRAGWVTAGIVGILTGAALTSLVAGSAAAGGTVAEAPTATDTITARDTTFVETTLQMNAGEVLGLFVVNEDPFAHSFDIDSLGVHVELPAGSTTAVTIRPSAADTLDFYCAVPGHTPAMAGVITVQ